MFKLVRHLDARCATEIERALMNIMILSHLVQSQYGYFNVINLSTFTSRLLHEMSISIDSNL